MNNPNIIRVYIQFHCSNDEFIRILRYFNTFNQERRLLDYTTVPDDFIIQTDEIRKMDPEALRHILYHDTRRAINYFIYMIKNEYIIKDLEYHIY
jgi:hypothetical protein